MTFEHICAAVFALVLVACAGVPDTDIADAEGDGAVTLIIQFEASDAGFAELSSIMDGAEGAMQMEAGFVTAKSLPECRHAKQVRFDRSLGDKGAA